MIKKVTDGVWKVRADSNVYFLDYEKKIIIDTGNRSKRQDLIFFLTKVVDPLKIDAVILTHLHYDHCGNIDLFPNAQVYASKEEIEDYKNDPEGAVLNEDTLERIKDVNLLSLPATIFGLQIVSAPGHTRGSVCIWDNDRKVLFSGDTFFEKRQLGRTDLKTSVPDRMMESVIKLARFRYEFLCPGHDY